MVKLIMTNWQIEAGGEGGTDTATSKNKYCRSEAHFSSFLLTDPVKH